MVKKYASLAGRGVEIMFGKSSTDDEETPNAEESSSVVIDVSDDESPEGDSASETESPGAEAELDTEDTVVDLSDAIPIDPELAALMEAEAESAEPSFDGEGELPPLPEDGVTVWPSITYAEEVVDLTGEDRPAAPEPEEEMASLAMANLAHYSWIHLFICKCRKDYQPGTVCLCHFQL